MPDHETVSPPVDVVLVDDLRLNLSDARRLLGRARSSGDVLDAYLLAAGASQILRDALEDDPAHLVRAASLLSRTGQGTLRRSLSRGAHASTLAIRRYRDVRGERGTLESGADRLDLVIGMLATSVHLGFTDPGIEGKLDRLLLTLDALQVPVGADTLRPPSCFRSFDQHPRDLAALADLVTRECPCATSAPLVVVGVRTSGSYLAPLLAAALSDLGCGEVPWATIRPGHPPTPAVRSRLVALASDGARVIVVDDPPTTGRSIDTAARQLERLGYEHERITLALGLLHSDDLPTRLGRYDAVLLRWSDWDIHRRLSAPVVGALLEERWGVPVVVEHHGSVVAPGQPSARGHARVDVEVSAPERTADAPRSLVAEGAGLGYFGRHVVAVSAALPGILPEIVCFGDGVVVREWLPDSSRARLDSPERVRQAIAYVTSRRAALPARRDAAASLAGQQPAWEVAARLLAAPYGVVGLAVRAAGLDSAVRSLLAPSTPSVVDGQTGARSWFERGGSLVKVSFSERSFSNLDLACYDAAYDVAGLALGTTSFELAELARRDFERETGELIDEERWLLYRLVHLWDLGRLEQLPPYAGEVAASRVWQEWARSRLLKGPLRGGEGPWCAIDIDGVLETSRLGVPVLTPSAARGLRALDAHGFCTVLATGRSHVELADRCTRYGLAGGVAEYGGIVYDGRSGVSHNLLDDDAFAALAACRERLSGLAGVQLPDQFSASVRAFRVAADGSRTSLDDSTIDSALRAARGQLQAHRGDSQVDFVPAEIDKATGLIAARSLLGAHGGSLAVAVGDSAADSSMLRAAERGFVPAHARHLAGGSVRATPHGFQRGFLDAVTQVLGHRPGACSTCRELSDERDGTDGGALLAAVLAGLEGGRPRGVGLVPELLYRSRRVLGYPRRSSRVPRSGPGA